MLVIKIILQENGETMIFPYVPNAITATITTTTAVIIIIIAIFSMCDWRAFASSRSLSLSLSYLMIAFGVFLEKR